MGPYSNNLGRSDEINIFDAAGGLVDRLRFGDSTFPGSVRTQGVGGWVSAAGLGRNDVYAWTAASVGDAEGSYEAASGSVGSPEEGRSTHPPRGQGVRRPKRSRTRRGLGTARRRRPSVLCSSAHDHDPHLRHVRPYGAVARKGILAQEANEGA